ncbi:MAG: hypothetical protein R3C08_13025 [Hyphomonas sp.]
MLDSMGEKMDKKPESTNPVVRFIEFCGTHPFATGLFAIISVASFLFAIYANSSSGHDSERVQQSVAGVQTSVDEVRSTVEGVRSSIEDVRSSMDTTLPPVEAASSVAVANCSAPPCWSAEEAVGRILDSTKDYIDSKIGVATSKSSSGWQYRVDDCPIRIHYSDETAIYFSHPISSSCPKSWQDMFWIKEALPDANLAVGDLYRPIFSQPYPPELHIATGCTNCGNYHEPYVEFVIPGPHVSHWYDRYFTVDFSAFDGSDSFDNNQRFERSLQSRTGFDANRDIDSFCGVDVKQSVGETLLNLQVTDVGYGRRGWNGRTGFAIDICNGGYTAR